MEIAVIDDGPGVNPMIRDQLFQPYVTTKAQGFGVGLAISRDIIKAHHGDLTMKTTNQPGACFVISLPL
jgi:signal transduction histidine kinase